MFLQVKTFLGGSLPQNVHLATQICIVEIHPRVCQGPSEKMDATSGSVIHDHHDGHCCFCILHDGSLFYGDRGIRGSSRFYGYLHSSS